MNPNEKKFVKISLNNLAKYSPLPNIILNSKNTKIKKKNKKRGC